MPDESTNPVGTTQTSQDGQATTNQPGNDFVLDFGDLGDNAPVAEDIEVDSSLLEEKKADDELGFDVDLGGDDQNSSDGADEGTGVETEDSISNDVSVVAPEEEKVNDFNISMDYEGNSSETIPENEEILPNEEEKVSENDEIIPDEEETTSESEEIVPDEEEIGDENEIIPDEVLSFTTDDGDFEEKMEENEEIIPEEETTLENEEIVPDEGEKVPENEEIASHGEENLLENEEIVPDEEETISENEEVIPDKSLNFIIDNTDSEELDNSQSEGHLFHQINEDDQNEFSFDSDNSNFNEISQSDEGTTADKPLFMGTNDTVTDESMDKSGEINFDLPEVSDNAEGLLELNIDAGEQKQPELGDLLSNSPIDLSKEFNDVSENLESDGGDMEFSFSEGENVDNPSVESDVSESVSEDNISEPILETAPNGAVEDTPESAIQGVESDPTPSVESQEFLLDEPENGIETQGSEQNVQMETVENVVAPETQNQLLSDDDRSEMVNKAASEMNSPDVVAPEINISTPVELSNVSSSQQEVASSESESQVQSTLSLDQILDSELLSNPQYVDNSKASPQNIPSNGGLKGKAGLFIGVGVAVLACCVAVLAFPSITTDRKPGDTVNTGTAVEYDTHSSGLDQPTERTEQPDQPENPIVGDDSQSTDIPDSGSLSGEGGGAQVVSFPEDEGDSGDGEASTEPVPYIWTDEGDGEEPEIQEPVVKEVDANQILDTILSFKSQAETYYSYGEEHADNQLMKYSLRLISLCDNYTDKVNNGEGLDSERLDSFKSTANKIINKIDTYLGGDGDVPVIREATIDGESYFEGKDELKEYIYNNR